MSKIASSGVMSIGMGEMEGDGMYKRGMECGDREWGSGVGDLSDVRGEVIGVKCALLVDVVEFRRGDPSAMDDRSGADSESDASESKDTGEGVAYAGTTFNGNSVCTWGDLFGGISGVAGRSRVGSGDGVS